MMAELDVEKLKWEIYDGAGGRPVGLLSIAEWRYIARVLEDRDRLHRILYAKDGVYAVLRIECAEVDANDWPDDLHPSDVIEKHLVRAYRAALESLESA